jgi:hypothetical protein
MALYYLNKENGRIVFYTDSGSLKNLLKFGCNELASVEYLLGRHGHTNKLGYIRNYSVSSNINACMKHYLPCSIQLKMLFDSGIVVSDFVVHFQNGIHAYTDKSDIIVKLVNEDQVTDLLEAFSVPLRICPALMTQPGVLWNLVPRTGSFEMYGSFKRISDWLSLQKYEKPIRRLCANPNNN